ncbi:hypothetical protein GOP47_0025005 [Adiantum capillus-veneris]|uniref:AAA+ ATPase domain-containing protein n=1 Tax=Adiantum capillus-veneris TaxID=13818 RepID=A0A9D4U3W1_ADICA|nr:hypothetical protein GOP47_0025005 [Adiantum capillus-veneris]
MDAPDFDELEWMAQQENPFPDCMQHSLDFEQEHEDVEFSHSAELSPELIPPEETWSPPAVGADRKRSFSPALEPDSRKRGKTSDNESFHDFSSQKVVENDWVLPQEAEWSPASPKIKTANCERVPNVDSKLPARRLADIEGNFMPITSPSGDRVYAEVKEARNLFGSLQSIHNSYRNSKHAGLLSESFEVLLDQVEQNLLKQDCRIVEGRDAFEDSMTESAVHEPLWVEKYSPKSFTELLSDEQTNREVLRWLKQWDKCVFGAKKTSTSLDVLAALKRHPPTFRTRRTADREGISAKNGVIGAESGSKGIQQTDMFSNQSINSKGSVTSSANKPLDDRPEEKILLLCGPPGLGKTTLAHVAARHCGYRVVEINASDDRVASTLQAKILDAVQMKSVMGDLRPNCVVIDEIDGALGGADGKGAIDALLKIAYAGTKELSGKVNEKDEAVIKKASKKNTSTTATLSRPVICICNDPYAPALRQLRQMAKVHVFTQPSVNRVVTRLKYICSLEDYKISARALTALADHTECDIRSCLNTLQFLRKKKESLNMLDVASQVVGRKDMTSSAFDVWGEILQKRKPKHGINIGSSGTSFGYGQEINDFLRLHDLLANHGDFELTNDGVYDNLTHIRYQDSSLQKMVQCLELLGDSEITSCYALRHQNFALTVYQPAFLLAIRRLVAQPEKPFMEWPKTFQRFRVERSAKHDLLRSWMLSMQPVTHRNFTAECLAWDLVSHLLCILAPQRLRPVAPQLLSQTEKEEMNELIDTMIAYGINYKTTKFGIDNVSEVQGPVLYPPIFKLVRFKDYKMEHPLLSSTLRQVLSHEVELEIIRRESLARAARAMSIASELQGLSLAAAGLQKDITMTTKVDDAERKPIPVNAFTESSKKKRTDATVAAKQLSKAPSKLAADAFARFRIVGVRNGKVEKDSRASNALAQRDSRPIFFRFNEGFTNAIRKPVLIRDLI